MNLTLDITALSSDGRGIARRPGEKVVFVSQALPGEQVEACVTQEKKSFCEAKVLRRLKPAENAVEPACPHQGECGGCPLMRMDYSDQLVWKQRFVQDALRKTGGLSDFPIAPIIASPAALGCRNRVELAIGKDDNGLLRLGMRRRTAHTIVPTPECALMDAEARAVLKKVEAVLQDAALSVYEGPAATDRKRTPSRKADSSQGFLRFCQIRTGYVPDALSLASASSLPAEKAVWVILLTSKGTAEETLRLKSAAENLLKACPAVHAVLHEERYSNDLLTQGERRIFTLGREGCTDPALMLMPLDGRGYIIDAADFFQVNTEAAGKLARTAAAQLPGCGSLLDLYCGSGAPGLNIAGREVWGIEYSKSAIRLARQNADRFSVAGHYEAGDASKVLARPAFRKAEASVVLCDPPRAGLSQAVIDFILEKKAEHLLYVSCNPATLARDVKLLAPCYAPASITPVDLFPQTPHVETVCLLTRKASLMK